MAASIVIALRDASNAVTRDVISFTAAISVCEKGGQWQQDVSLFEEMHRVTPTLVLDAKQ